MHYLFFLGLAIELRPMRAYFANFSFAGYGIHHRQRFCCGNMYIPNLLNRNLKVGYCRNTLPKGHWGFGALRVFLVNVLLPTYSMPHASEIVNDSHSPFGQHSWIHTPGGKRGISCFSAGFPCGGKCGKVWLVDKTETIDQGNSFMTWKVPG